MLNYYSGKIEYSLMDESAYTFINFIYEPMETSVNCIAVSTDSPYETMEDLLDAARATQAPSPAETVLAAAPL